MATARLFCHLFLFSALGFAWNQKPLAESCRKGSCYKFTIDIREKTDRIFFDVTNNTQGAKDIELFLEDKDGVWYSQGYTVKPLAFKEKTTFDRFHTTSNYIIYYRNAGDETVRFPTQAEVREKFGKKKYGYGAYR